MQRCSTARRLALFGLLAAVLAVLVEPSLARAADVVSSTAVMSAARASRGVRHKRPSVIERALPTSIADSNKFLYEGDDALQLGVAAGVIVRDRVAVIHGKVQARDGSALESVRFSVHGHPELGRTAKLRNGTLEDQFIYRSALQPALWIDPARTPWRLVYALGRNVPDYMTNGPKTYRLITDHLGSVRFVVDVSDGTLVQRTAYDAWGAPTEDWAAPGWVRVPFGFGGGIYDRDTGLVRFGARDYDPSIGRWTAKDPLLFGGGDTNLYLYAGGDPVNRVDPSGQFILPALWAAVDAAAILLGFGASAPSDTAAVPANVWGMIFSVLPLKGLPGLGGAGGGMDLVVQPGSPLMRQIVGDLSGVTPVSEAIGTAISQGAVRVHLCNSAGFAAAARGAGIGWAGRIGLRAFAQGRSVFVRIGRSELGDIVHEGGHALRFMDGTSTYTGARHFGLKLGDFAEASAVRAAERMFLRAKGLPHRSAGIDYLETFFYLF